jgi:hypothetical protein
MVFHSILAIITLSTWAAIRIGRATYGVPARNTVFHSILALRAGDFIAAQAILATYDTGSIRAYRPMKL